MYQIIRREENKETIFGTYVDQETANEIYERHLLRNEKFVIEQIQIT